MTNHRLAPKDIYRLNVMVAAAGLGAMTLHHPQIMVGFIIFAMSMPSVIGYVAEAARRRYQPTVRVSVAPEPRD